MMIAGLSMSSALVVGTPSSAYVARVSSPVATVAAQQASNDGPYRYWEDKGPLQNPPKEENEFKEYDTFSTFVAACASHGVDLAAADITVFAPANKACDEYSAVYGPMSKAVCQYHVVKGVVGADALSGADLTTLEGSKITYRRMFRKHFVDNAFCGAMASPPRSSYPGDVKADNGLIHMVNEVIYPGWTESSGGTGAVGDSEATRA
jgi:uncharacterized surface protein with fasciclin (FAS1) repeats